MTARCIAAPISWLRLEQLASSGAADAHLAACAACAACLAEIRADVVALPPLTVATRAPARRWWVVPGFAAAAAAIAVVIVILTRPPATRPEHVVAIKGVGEVVLDVVRERDGAITDGARSSRPTDRWKVVVTCAPGPAVPIEVTVDELGGTASDRPLAPARIACGNRVALPGAFALTGARPNRICIQVAGEAARACVTVVPER